MENRLHYYRRIILHLCSIMVVGILLFSCSDKFETINNDQSHEQAAFSTKQSTDMEVLECTEGTEVYVGERLRNPYHYEVMQEAYQIISDLGYWSFTSNTPPEYPLINAFYFRVLPSSYEELGILLSDEDIIYSSIPFDYQIDEDCGDYYMDPECPSDTITWLYAVIPTTHALPQVGTAQVEVLDYLHIPEEIEPVQSGETDGIGLLEYLAYKLTGNLDEWEEEDIDYYEIFFSGIGTSNYSGKNSRGLLSKKYPAGTLRVHNTDKDSLEGMNRVQVLMYNFGKSCKVVTDENGHYVSTIPFRTKVRYAIRFFNEPTRTSILPTFPIMGSAQHRLGRHSKTGLSYDCYTNSKAWRYATINNALMKNYSFNEEYGIPTPEGLNIWVIGNGYDDWAGSTPLLHLSQGVYSNLTFDILAFTGLPLLFVLVPDILLFEEQNENSITSELSETVFHELAHASHYLQVGDTYWDHYISHIIWNRGYGDDENSSIFAGYCGIGEMWATYIGLFYLAKYQGQPMLSQIEVPSWSICEQWFKPCIMIEIGNRIYDSDADVGNMYRSLQDDVHDLDALRWRMNTEGISTDIVDDAIDMYGYWN